MLLKIIDFIINIIDKSYHQKRLIKTLKNISNDYQLIIDVGFHKGEYSKLFLQYLFPKKIIGFEASEKSYLNYIKKKKSNQIKLYNIGVSSKKGLAVLKVYGKESINSFESLNPNSVYSKIKNNLLKLKATHENVKLDTLDNLLHEFKRIDLLKIDVEGHELDVLKGAKNCLHRTKIIMIEIHHSKQYSNYSKDKIIKLLEKSNFTLYKKIKFPLMKWEDRIFVNEKY